MVKKKSQLSLHRRKRKAVIVSPFKRHETELPMNCKPLIKPSNLQTPGAETLKNGSRPIKDKCVLLKDQQRRGRGFEPHRRHCLVSLSKNINPSLVLVQPRKTRPFITERLLMGRKESNQTNKQTKDPELLLGANNLDLQPHLLLTDFCQESVISVLL